MRFMTTLALLVGFAACSAPTVNNQINNNAAMKEKDTANNVKTYAKSTPPTGGTSMGMMSSPKAGSQTIPIQNVEVYLFTANIDDDAAGETMYWAYDGEVIYVWGSIDIECVDEDDVETGETGDAYFIMEADAEGYGWMVATDSCGYSTIYGCSGDDSGETCGGCDFDDEYIVCVAEESD
jgi:hypothetical protein